MKHIHRLQMTHTGLLAATLLMFILVPYIHAQSGGMLSYDSRVFGTISADMPRAVYSFAGSAGDQVTIRVENWTGTLDVRADLIAPNAVLLATSSQNTRDDNVMGAYLSAVLPLDGLYAVWIRGQNNTTGDFTLALTGHSAPVSTPLVFGQPLEISLMPGAAPLLYSFEAQRCPTSIQIENLDGGQPITYPFVARLRDQRGQAVGMLRGGEEREAWLTVMPQSGRYELEIFSDDAAAAGRIRLLVTCAPDMPTCPTSGSGVPGVVVSEPCTPCPGPDQLLEGGCPDLGFTVMQDEHDPVWVTANWNVINGATSYVLYIYGRITPDAEEIFLTHSVGSPGDPTWITFALPDFYVSYRFVLRVNLGDDLLCTGEAAIAFEPPDRERIPICEDFSTTVTLVDAAWVQFEWTEYPGAEGYGLYLWHDGLLMLGYPSIVSPAQRDYALPWPEPGSYTFAVGPWFASDGTVCRVETYFEIKDEPQQFHLPCFIRTNSEFVEARVGPAFSRSVFAYLTPGIDYLVIGQAVDDGGNLWWQIDKTMVPGHEAVISLWVLASDVEVIGECDNVPPGDVPPVIPWEPNQPGDGPPRGPDGWGPCGSCDTCGHPSSECVTSPEGMCLWDPATCIQTQQVCYIINATVDMGRCQSPGSAMLDTPPNCASGYLQGTIIDAHAVAVDPKCNVDYWTGCGVTSGENSISFTATASCTLTAHMAYTP